MMQKIYKFFKEKGQKGQSIIEYGILITAVIAAVVAFKTSFDVSARMSEITAKVNNQFSSANASTTDVSSGSTT